jgi:prophage DNA circulation protein
MKLYTAKLDDWDINILDITDTVAMAIVKHEFVNTDGAYLQHMGNRPREISFRTFWFGIAAPSETSKATYLNHYHFLDTMSNSSISHTLIHPKYGEIDGYVESLSMVHDDTQDYVVIDVKFVQMDIQTLELIPVNTIADMETQEARALNAALKNASTMMAAGGASSLLGKTIDFSQTIASQINNVSQDIRSFCNELDTNISIFDTCLHDITAPLTSVDASVAFAADIPSRLIGSIVGAANRIVTSLAAISNLPVQFINNLTLGLDNLYSSMSFAPGSSHAVFFQTQFRNVACAKVLGMASSLLQADQTNRSAAASKETRPAFDIYGNRINTVTFDTFMTTNDLINFSTLIRKYVQKTLILDRSNDNAKQMAMSIQQYVQDTKVKAMTVKTITVSSMPIFSLLQLVGLPYQAADRVLALNPDIKNPNFIQGEVKIYAK